MCAGALYFSHFSHHGLLAHRPQRRDDARVRVLRGQKGAGRGGASPPSVVGAHSGAAAVVGDPPQPTPSPRPAVADMDRPGRRWEVVTVHAAPPPLVEQAAEEAKRGGGAGGGGGAVNALAKPLLLPPLRPPHRPTPRRIRSRRAAVARGVVPTRMQLGKLAERGGACAGNGESELHYWEPLTLCFLANKQIRTRRPAWNLWPRSSKYRAAAPPPP